MLKIQLNILDVIKQVCLNSFSSYESFKNQSFNFKLCFGRLTKFKFLYSKYADRTQANLKKQTNQQDQILSQQFQVKDSLLTGIQAAKQKNLKPNHQLQQPKVLDPFFANEILVNNGQFSKKSQDTRRSEISHISESNEKNLKITKLQVKSYGIEDSKFQKDSRRKDTKSSQPSLNKGTKTPQTTFINLTKKYSVSTTPLGSPRECGQISQKTPVQYQRNLSNIKASANCRKLQHSCGQILKLNRKIQNSNVFTSTERKFERSSQEQLFIIVPQQSPKQYSQDPKKANLQIVEEYILIPAEECQNLIKNQELKNRQPNHVIHNIETSNNFPSTKYTTELNIHTNTPKPKTSIQRLFPCSTKNLPTQSLTSLELDFENQVKKGFRHRVESMDLNKDEKKAMKNTVFYKVIQSKLANSIDLHEKRKKVYHNSKNSAKGVDAQEINEAHYRSSSVNPPLQKSLSPTPRRIDNISQPLHYGRANQVPVLASSPKLNLTNKEKSSFFPSKNSEFKFQMAYFKPIEESKLDEFILKITDPKAKRKVRGFSHSTTPPPMIKKEQSIRIKKERKIGQKIERRALELEENLKYIEISSEIQKSSSPSRSPSQIAIIKCGQTKSIEYKTPTFSQLDRLLLELKTNLDRSVTCLSEDNSDSEGLFHDLEGNFNLCKNKKFGTNLINFAGSNIQFLFLY